jgi:hypothetical protein
MPAENKVKELPARPRISKDCWWRIQAAAAAVREKPEAYLEKLAYRHLPPAFRGKGAK